MATGAFGILVRLALIHQNEPPLLFRFSRFSGPEWGDLFATFKSSSGFLLSPALFMISESSYDMFYESAGVFNAICRLFGFFFSV